MFPLGSTWVRRDVALAAAVAGLVGLIVAVGAVIASAQDAAPPPAGAEAPAPRPVKKHSYKIAPGPVPIATQPTPAGPDIAGRLRAAGAGTCAAQFDTAAVAAMGNVAAFNTVSNWPKTAVAKRMASVSIGQKYPGGSAIPYGVTTLVAAPNPVGPCDAMSVQVLPSPLPCDKVRDNMTAAKSRVIGDLSGVLVVEDANGGETLLVPTVANACVLVGVRTAFGR